MVKRRARRAAAVERIAVFDYMTIAAAREPDNPEAIRVFTGTRAILM